MMQQLTPNRFSFDPTAVDVALDIDPLAKSVTLSGRRYVFTSSDEMERFLARLWDSEVPCKTSRPLPE